MNIEKINVNGTVYDIKDVEDVAAEKARAQAAESELQKSIAAEVERAEAAEEQLQKDIDTTRFSRITGDGAILATGNSMRGFSPGRIYRFIFDKQVETAATTGYTMFGVVAIDANGKRYSLGDATRVAESVTHAPYYDYAIPNIEGPISIEPSARLEKDLEVTIKAEDITEIKVPYKCEYGTILIPYGTLIDSEEKIRARVLVPISNGSGLKRILFNAADGIENTGVVYAFKNGEFIERITATAGRKVVEFYGNSDFDNVLVLFKKTDDSAISASELNSICVYSDIDINNTIACENYRNINIDFERGMLAENGNPYAAITNAARFSGSIQRLFLTWSPCNHIISELPTGCTIYCYNSAFAIIGTTKDKNSIPQNTAYIKLSSELPIYSLTLTVKMQGQVEFVKNGIYANSEYPRYRAISYEMKFPIEGDVEPTLEYQGNDEFVWNNGYIILPHNYDPKGKPVPLIIRCHGTGGYTWGQTELSSTTKDYIFFLAKNGFAVADCSAMTSKYSAQRDCNVPNKISFACYCNLYKYLVDNFNIKTDGVYISGKSAGGMNSAAMGILQPFPIKAVAGLAPSLDFYTNMRFISAASDVNWAFQQLGIPFYAEENSYKPLLTVTEEAKSILMANIDKVAGYSAMGMFNDVDIEHFYERALSDNLFALEEDTELMAIVASAHKIQPAPMKIWHAIDDDAVPISTSRFYRTMVRNAGGVCYLREFPVGCGKHYAVDSGENAPRVDYLCANGETANVPVAYAEMLEWFKQW
ncbi:MAG: hypothetical protein J6Q73_07810 [Bacteroidaceae bacterium]|nr:hypothetical protein [Bacteroidaceae bacterium]